MSNTKGYIATVEIFFPIDEVQEVRGYDPERLTKKETVVNLVEFISDTVEYGMEVKNVRKV